MLSNSRRAFSQWLHGRLAAQKSKTVALLVTEDEIKDKQLDCLSHLHESEDFRNDLIMHKCAWFYTKDSMKRTLLLNFKPNKEKSGEVKHEKALRALGATAVSQLQAMKAADVEVIASGKINAEHLGIFANSMHLSNYEFTLKSDLKEEDSKEECHDQRTKRTKKTIDSITIAHEKELDQLQSYNFYKHCTDATIFARNLANTRGNPATTQWMEDQVRAMLSQSHTDTQKLIKDVRIVRGEELKQQGMNLFYAVG
jgi:leucyl aminopeptidase